MCRSSDGRISVKYRSRIGRVSMMEYCIGRHDSRSTIGRLSTDYRPTVGRLSTDYRPIVDRLSTDYRPIVGRQSTDIAVDIAAAISTEATYSTHDPNNNNNYYSNLKIFLPQK